MMFDDEEWGHLPDSDDQGGHHYHPGNRLNDLSGREWIQATKSWFILNPPKRSADIEAHPATFPPGLAAEFILFFTKKGGWVLDPFAGIGTTLVTAQHLGRNAIGTDIVLNYCEATEEQLMQGREAGFTTINRIMCEDVARLAKRVLITEKYAANPIDLTITSPPYWNMLSQSRGGVESASQKRKARGLATSYPEPGNLGNVSDYPTFLSRLADGFSQVRELTRPGGYLVVVAQNFRLPDGNVQTFAWDLARQLTMEGWLFQGERIWCQNNKPLGIWGYPKLFVPNYHHHYCLIFRNI